MTTPYVSIILPIYNEEARLPMCLAHVCDYFWHYTHWKFEVVCVLNGCTDNSARIACQFAGHWEQVKILSLPTAGKGLAVRAGMLLAQGRYRYMSDVDLATPITEFPRFLAAAQSGADLVAGRRSVHHTSPVRAAAHAGYRLLARPLARVHDPQCGFKLFRDECARRVFEQVRTPGWGFDVEALYLADKMGYRIDEIPVRWEHVPGSKLSPLADGLQMAKELFAIRKQYAI